MVWNVRRDGQGHSSSPWFSAQSTITSILESTITPILAASRCRSCWLKLRGWSFRGRLDQPDGTGQAPQPAGPIASRPWIRENGARPVNMFSPDPHQGCQSTRMSVFVPYTRGAYRRQLLREAPTAADPRELTIRAQVEPRSTDSCMELPTRTDSRSLTRSTTVSVCRVSSNGECTAGFGLVS